MALVLILVQNTCLFEGKIFWLYEAWFSVCIMNIYHCKYYIYIKIKMPYQKTWTAFYPHSLYFMNIHSVIQEVGDVGALDKGCTDSLWDRSC